GVVGDDVDDDLQPQLVGAADHLVGVRQRTEAGVDVGVVGHVVAAVLLRGGVEGREPDRVDAEVAQVGQSRGDAGQVAHAVAVRVGERAGVDLVDDGVAPPLPVGAALPLGGLRSGQGRSGHGVVLPVVRVVR